MVRPSSTASPSIWWNTGLCVASSASLRKHLPGLTTYSGSGLVSMARIWTGEVCVRSTMPDRAPVRAGHEERVLHLPGRMVGREVQRVEVVPLGLDLGALGDLVAHPDEHVGQPVGQGGDRMPGAGADAGPTAGSRRRSRPPAPGGPGRPPARPAARRRLRQPPLSCADPPPGLGLRLRRQRADLRAGQRSAAPGGHVSDPAAFSSSKVAAAAIAASASSVMRSTSAGASAATRTGSRSYSVRTSVLSLDVAKVIKTAQLP